MGNRTSSGSTLFNDEISKEIKLLIEELNVAKFEYSTADVVEDDRLLVVNINPNTITDEKPVFISCSENMKEIAKKEDIPLEIVEQKCHSLLLQKPNPYQLTDDEILAILYYSADLGTGLDSKKNIYYILNQRLRQGQYKLWENFLFHLQNGLSKIPSSQNVVYRGVPDKDLLTNYHQAREIQWSGYTSTTLKREIAYWFANRNPTTVGAIMIININNGKSICDYSCIRTEHEILLSPNSKFVVDRALYEEEGIWYIKLVEFSREEPLRF